MERIPMRGKQVSGLTTFPRGPEAAHSDVRTASQYCRFLRPFRDHSATAGVLEELD
jgi:hypothetical protein